MTDIHEQLTKDLSIIDSKIDVLIAQRDEAVDAMKLWRAEALAAGEQIRWEATHGPDSHYIAARTARIAAGLE